jgi:hypothetical protein
MAQVRQRHAAAFALAERLRLMWRVSSLTVPHPVVRPRRAARVALQGRCHQSCVPRRLVLRIAQRILALTIEMLLNTISGRPARALAAHDGR